MRGERRLKGRKMGKEKKGRGGRVKEEEGEQGRKGEEVKKMNMIKRKRYVKKK